MKQIEYSIQKYTRKKILFSDKEQVVEIARFPKGTQLIVNATVDEAFNNSNVLSVGINKEANNIIDNFSLIALAGKNADRRVLTDECDNIVYAKITKSATAGAVTVSVDYILPSSQEVSF